MFANTYPPYEFLRSYAFDSPDYSAAIPKGMYGGRGIGSGKYYEGREGYGDNGDSYVVLAMDERRFHFGKPVGRTALLHIVSPNNNNLLGGLQWAENFDVETLAFENKTPGGLVATHEASIPSHGYSRGGEVINFIASMSGAPMPEGWQSPQDIVDLDWREAMPGDFEHFAGTVQHLMDAHAERLAR